jgi:lipoic acid synthetase
MSLKPALRKHNVNTVCESARCPNIGECFAKKQATFLIAGTTCTRGCAFCAIKAGRPDALDASEPARIANIVKELKLSYVVITSVTRDDLGDGGALHFCETVAAVRAKNPGTKIEILVPDFQGNRFAARDSFACKPDVYSHNLETVPRLYEAARIGASFERSLELLDRAHRAGLLTKSGLMLGLGETIEEVRDTMKALRAAHCDILTLGQYLAPADGKYPVQREVGVAEFDTLKAEALALGFKACASAPYVRSSYLAESYLPGD